MAKRQNFTNAQRQSAFEVNAHWLRDHRVDGIEIAVFLDVKRKAGQIYYCENCLFCHTDKAYFDVDHLVPDRLFRDWNRHPEAKAAVNMMILCKSREKGDYGCNQTKQAQLRVPRNRGLAHSKRELDMNCFPVHERPFEWC